MQATALEITLDQRTTGLGLEGLAERLRRPERLGETDVDENTFADAKNDALALQPSCGEIRAHAVRIFGKSILSVSPPIGELDLIYDL
jgi:hypothetical protein